MNNNIKKGFFWKLFERFGVTGIQFILQIVLARILDPEHYGILSIMIIFTTLANVFIQNGFNTSLIQNKDVTDDDYSSVFWVSILIAVALYALIFTLAPLIAAFYEMPDIVMPLRIISLMLIPGALNSIQLAKVSREMNFKNVFISNIGAIVVSGATGIIIALNGGGLWALVAQTLVNVVVATVIMMFTVKLRIKLICNLKRVKILFSYGWKLLVSSLIDTLYMDLRSLVIGKKYNEETLGYYNRGKQFPQFIITAVNSTVQSVMLPAISKEQDNSEKVKSMVRSSMSTSAYIIFPIMAGLAAVATPLISILLTDKWLPCVVYLQIYCFTLAFTPIHSCNLQAINAVGRSDLFLKLEIIKKTIGIISLLISVFYFDSPIAIALTGVFTTISSCFINAYPNRKLINYSYLEQFKDLASSFGIAVIMCVCVLLLGTINLNNWFLLIIQVLSGIAIYVGLSILFKPKPFRFLIDIIKTKLKKKEN